MCGAQYWRQGGSACSGDLRCGCARHRRALVSVPDDLSRDFVGLLQVLGELGSEGLHIVRRLRQR